jgi:hypothetical protein
MRKMSANQLRLLRQFCHRLKDDGTFDSICMKCFATVANADLEGALLRSEYAHVCGRQIVERVRDTLRE